MRRLGGYPPTPAEDTRGEDSEEAYEASSSYSSTSFASTFTPAASTLHPWRSGARWRGTLGFVSCGPRTFRRRQELEAEAREWFGELDPKVPRRTKRGAARDETRAVLEEAAGTR